MKMKMKLEVGIEKCNVRNPGRGGSLFWLSNYIFAIHNYDIFGYTTAIIGPLGRVESEFGNTSSTLPAMYFTFLWPN